MELWERSALGLRDMLDRREISSTELVQALYRRADQVDGKVRALVYRFEEQALAAARDADEARGRGLSYGPLHGLPVTIKESISTRGVPTTLGVKSQLGTPAADDAVVVKLLRRAGAIVIGKTNISQTLLFNESYNPIWGQTNNPWDLSRVPGGSSGGEAAALACGVSVLGVGTDIGGSIRVPAAYCGVAGLKPTIDRWSQVGCRGAMPGQEMVRAQCGPMARSARELAFLFRALDGPGFAALDPMVPPLPNTDPLEIDLSQITVGVYEDDGFFTPALSVRRAVREAAEALRRAGVKVVPAPTLKASELTYLYFAMLSSDGGRTLDVLLAGDAVVPQLLPLRLMAKAPAPLKRVLAAFAASQGEERLEKMLEVVHEKSVSEVWALIAERNRLRQEVLSSMEVHQVDVLLGPPHVTPALRHGQSRDFSMAGCYAFLYNMLNFPAGVVPVSRVRPSETERPQARDRLDKVAALVEQGSAGLPLAVQVAARPYREDLCLAVMIAIEDQLGTRPDFPRTPVTP